MDGFCFAVQTKSLSRPASISPNFAETNSRSLFPTLRCNVRRKGCGLVVTQPTGGHTRSRAAEKEEYRTSPRSAEAAGTAPQHPSVRIERTPPPRARLAPTSSSSPKYGVAVSSEDDSAARPLLDERTPLYEGSRGSSSLARVTRFAGAAAIGALVVAAGFIGADPSHPALQKIRGISDLGEGRTSAPAAYRRAAPIPARNNRLGSTNKPSADPVGRLGGVDDIAHIDSLDAQVERLTRELIDARSESTELEKQVQTLEQSIVDTREEFLKIGHGGKNKHLAGSHENDIIADLEIQLKDKHYELEKTRQQKYKLYLQTKECNSAQAELDKSVAECKKNMIEYAERATALEKMESCSAEKEAVESKLTTATEKLEVALADLAAARGDDHDDNSRIASLESKLGDCHDNRDASADTITDYKKAVETDRPRRSSAPHR